MAGTASLTPGVEGTLSVLIDTLDPDTAELTKASGDAERTSHFCKSC
jgi:hypothetical protein